MLLCCQNSGQQAQKVPIMLWPEKLMGEPLSVFDQSSQNNIFTMS